MNITLRENCGIGLWAAAALLLPATLLLAGCQEEVVEVVADLPPSAPDGVFSITGDLEVTICWNPNPETDIAGYDIYWNDQPTGFFEYVATVGPNDFCYTDTDVTNGTTYFYAVLAFDQAGQDSELSLDNVFDTPRPEGVGLVLFDYLGPSAASSGYDFSAFTVQRWDDPGTDVYFGAPNSVPTLFADQGAGVDIQDYGYIDLVGVDWAPLNGWTKNGMVELIQGHSYIIRIASPGNKWNMAKVYVGSVGTASVTLDWAYQISENNPELTPGIGGAQR